ncbi:hypothetical protein EG345_00355 [Chryseobacterium carnipullorum]|uniref:hypothetical protein n=1 Tax=Chryseobacterium carnipullorum TaxID=1124835 RepID=UPI000F50085C|nr:hypothetical protein [Chryseobacterium carnipullorum]AZA63329.1 hypothetical protein EG345_00355 [Chryseobacterium carnipullorum]
MNRKEFEEKYKNAKLPEDLQELLNNAAKDANLILSEYETEYQKIQHSYSSFFHTNGIIKPYDIKEFFSWIANRYPDKNLSFIIEVAKNPNSYKMFHDYNLSLFNGKDNNITNLDAWNINEIFDFIRNEDIAEFDIYKLLKNYTENFDSEIIRSVLKDLEFYLFVEKEEIEAKFSFDEVDSAIALRKEKGLEIPYYKSIEANELTEKQKQFRRQAEEKGFNFDNPIINKEQLLFPYEFMNLYRLKNLLNSKLQGNNKKSNEPITKVITMTQLKILI